MTNPDLDKIRECYTLPFRYEESTGDVCDGKDYIVAELCGVRLPDDMGHLIAEALNDKLQPKCARIPLHDVADSLGETLHKVKEYLEEIAPGGTR